MKTSLLIRPGILTFLLLAGLTRAQAEHELIADTPGYRTPLPNEGYLKFMVNPAVGRFGEESTGWLDVRHPAMDGTTDVSLGYDRSDHSVLVDNKVLTVDAAGGGPEVATPDRARDFYFANKAYMLQAGLSVISAGSTAVDFSTGNGAGNPVITSTIDAADRDIIQAQNRVAGTLNNWYGSIGNGGAALRGVARPPTAFPGTSGTMIFNSAVNDTFAHEAFHYFGDGNAIHMPSGGDPGHSTDPANLIADGSIRLIPTSPAEIGPVRSPTVGGKDKLETSQVTAMFAPGAPGGAIISKNVNLAAGDRVDFDFVNDQYSLEDIPGADNHTGGTDSLYFGIGMTVASPQAGKDKTGLATFGPLGDFNLPFFTQVDVFSLGLRYSDSDVESSGNLSLREWALDYEVYFRDANGVTAPGTLTQVFIGGWTGTTFADDYLGRWTSPFNAVGVFIFAHPAGADGHDGNVQIDAVIAGVPEPSTAALFGVGIAVALWRRGRSDAVKRAM